MTNIADLLDDNTVTKITNLNITNVDLVSSPANKRSFLLRKSADEPNPSIFDASQVREFAKQAQEGIMTDPTEPVVKDEEILADAPAGAEGDEAEPGSPAWEAVDAATGGEALAALFQVKRVLDVLVDREATEAFKGDDDGFENSWDLENACGLVDAAISILAPYVAGELDESAQPVEKSGASVRDGLAEFVSFVKAGRSLSSANEAVLRSAAAGIQSVLASLPPVDDVAKAEEPAAVVPEEDVAKAASDPQVLVYDADGNVIGSVDPAKLTTFAPAPESATAEAAEDPAEEAAETPAEEAAEPAEVPADPADAVVADVAPDAAPDATVIPGTETVQSPPVPDDTKTVTKGLTPELAAALKEVLEPFAKQAGLTSELAEKFEALQERVTKMGLQPDDRNAPLLNGATGTSGNVSRDAVTDEFSTLRKAVAEAKTQDEIVKSHRELALAGLAARVHERFTN